MTKFMEKHGGFTESHYVKLIFLREATALVNLMSHFCT